MIHAFQLWKTSQASTPAREGHGVQVEYLLDAGVEEGHATHDARFVGEEDGLAGEEVVAAVLR